jgi:tRNA A-37 threonylcarbamoyl transferase component Bud32
MDYKKLYEFTYQELKEIADKMGINVSRNKVDLVRSIKEGLREFEHYKHKKIDRYTKHQQLGNKGKEGVTYLVTTKSGKEYAMKTFRKQKSSDNLRKEAFLQKMASDQGVAPNVIDTDTVSKYIVMEKMDTHLTDVMKEQSGNLTHSQQKQLINIYKSLDKALVFHGDSNVLNYMLIGTRIYIIDFGMSKEITTGLVKKLNTHSPNLDLMTLGLILKLKEFNCPKSSYEILKKYISHEIKIKFMIN